METRNAPGRARLSMILAAMVATLSGCLAPTNGHLMDLNRNGKWREAERIGLSMLKEAGILQRDDALETYYHVAYAKARQGKKDEAIALLAAYEKLSLKKEIPPRLRWLPREAARLERELGVLSPVQELLVEALEQNGKGKGERAIELAQSVIADPAANDVQRAQAHLLSAICRIRLSDAAGAEASLAAYDALEAALPPGHYARADAEAARHGLKELETR